jgi:hypothetical protein
MAQEVRAVEDVTAVPAEIQEVIAFTAAAVPELRTKLEEAKARVRALEAHRDELLSRREPGEEGGEEATE